MSLLLDIISLNTNDISLLFSLSDIHENSEIKINNILNNLDKLPIDFSKLPIKQQNVHYGKVVRDPLMLYTDEELQNSYINPNDLLHIALYNVYLIHNYIRGCTTYRCDCNKDIFVIDTKGIIRILPSPNSGSIAIEYDDANKYIILEYIEKKMKFDSFNTRSVSIFAQKLQLENEDILLRLMTMIEKKWSELRKVFVRGTDA